MGREVMTNITDSMKIFMVKKRFVHICGIKYFQKPTDMFLIKNLQVRTFRGTCLAHKNLMVELSKKCSLLLYILNIIIDGWFQITQFNHDCYSVDGFINQT